MSETSANLGLSYLQSAQAQKHVTVNESFLRLDALTQLSVEAADVGAQPGSPSDGALYILPAGKTGAAWGAMANHALAYWRDGAWEEIAPREGWVAYDRANDAVLVFNGGAWSSLSAAMRVSATDRILGRVSAGAGAAEEVPFTDQAQQLCDDISFAAMRTTLGAAGLSDANVFSNGNTFASAVARDGAAGTNRQNLFTSAGSNRWAYGVDNTAEGGANAGSNFILANFSDAGGFLSVALTVSRATGVFAFAATPTVGGASVFHGGAHCIPSADNTRNLGSASFRFATVYAGTGTINTSDAREKTPFTPIPAGVKRAVRRIFAEAGVFQWRARVAEKGDDARLHIGVTAQAVAAAFEAEGEDPRRWALFCADRGPDGAELLSLRTDQVLMLAAAALMHSPH